MVSYKDRYIDIMSFRFVAKDSTIFDYLNH